MKIALSSKWIDPDDGTIEFTCAAEIPGFQGNTSFYGLSDEFNEFAGQLLRFPFESKAPVVYEAYKFEGKPFLRIDIRLRDTMGAIDFRLQLLDDLGNEAVLNDASVRAQALHDLANALQHADFTDFAEIIWDTHTYSEH